VVEKMAEFGLLELGEKSRTLRREVTLFSNSAKKFDCFPSKVLNLQNIVRLSV
jgi:hypothetical protein